LPTDIKQLCQTVLTHEVALFGEERRSQPPATASAIAAAERRLGLRLPLSFKEFARQVGEAAWPLAIHDVEALTRSGPDDDRPSFLVAFATDDAGNDWCFDTRDMQGQEYGILYWDHEDLPDPEELEAGYHATPFHEWLAERISEALEDSPAWTVS
jgi:hypothetical protein